MGMPHPYKAPLLLVEGPVLEDYAGQGQGMGTCLLLLQHLYQACCSPQRIPTCACVGHPMVVCGGTVPADNGACVLHIAVGWYLCADREGRPRQPGASGPVFHIRGLCVAHVYT
jgi:hypothetical protein